MLTRADVNDNVKSSLGFPFTNSCFFNVHLTLETMTESQFCVSVGCDGFRKSVSGRIDSSASVSLSPGLFLLCLSLFLSPSFLPSFSLLPFLPSFLLQVDALGKNHPYRPSPCVFYVHEISQEFAYVQITSRWFEISHRQICLRQPSLFRRSALQTIISVGRAGGGTDPAGCGMVSGIFSFGLRGPSPQAFTPFGEVGFIARRLRRP